MGSETKNILYIISIQSTLDKKNGCLSMNDFSELGQSL